MAIRYSGDTEVRVTRQPAGWEVTVRDPKGRWRGHLPRRLFDTTDKAAVRAIREAERETRRKFAAKRKGNRIEVSPMFEAPCPCDELAYRPTAKRASARNRR